jgi:amino acid adenylation domain-containing protein
MDAALWQGFLESVERYPERPALEVNGSAITYHDLAQLAKRLAAAVQEATPANAVPLTAVFCYRSQAAYAGVLAALLAGHGYVPLNRTFPAERTRFMLAKADCAVVIVDQASERQLPDVLQGVGRQMTIICPDRSDVTDLAARFPMHRVIGNHDLPSAETWNRPGLDADAIAYLLFTSGSTGEPKGVMVTHSNVNHYLAFASDRYRITNEDRLSQTFDLTFDLSVHDMFMAWKAGACLCCPNQKQLIKPGGYIVESRLTVWFSVPSTALFMQRLGELSEGAYPNLRLSLFCGEALPVTIAQQWSKAAPNSVVENIYGPTELTIACTYYRWEPDRSPAEAENGIVPIGETFPAMEPLIVDETLAESNEGELLVTGPQRTPGYWRAEEKTRRAHVAVPKRDGIYYRTGDRVRRTPPGGPMVYLGRMDGQVKVTGHRVELGEIEAALRTASANDAVVALAWPVSEGRADGVEAFVQAEAVDAEAVTQQLRKMLPGYMVPRHIHALARFPLNANGKFDRIALRKTLEKEL